MPSALLVALCAAALLVAPVRGGQLGAPATAVEDTCEVDDTGDLSLLQTDVTLKTSRGVASTVTRENGAGAGAGAGVAREDAAVQQRTGAEQQHSSFSGAQAQLRHGRHEEGQQAKGQTTLRTHSRVHRHTGRGKGKNIPASWFGGFDIGESTFDPDAVQSGDANWEIETAPGLVAHGGVDGLAPRWFAESASAGDKMAWQTFYPAIYSVDSAGNYHNPYWYQLPSGDWQQGYEPAGLSAVSGQKQAQWFDNSVMQYDDFGRHAEPTVENAMRYIEWEARTINVKLGCADPGCVANGTIDMYDTTKEQARHCTANFKVNPTDFDGDHSIENIQYIMINDEVVNTLCWPGISSCNKTQQVPMWSCLSDLPVMGLIASGKGTLDFSAKITQYVDECRTQDGFLLDAVASVTCFVAPLLKPLTGLAAKTSTLSDKGACVLQCATPDCTASCTISLDKKLISGRTCTFSFSASQTDYDNEDTSYEAIEYVKVGATQVATNVKPGLNPCKFDVSGRPVSAANMNYQVVTGADVTPDVATGTVVVTGKISQRVDECAHEGMLLHGLAVINCPATR